MNAKELRSAVESDIREHELIAPGGEVTCLVSGGADSTCLWHVLRELNRVFDLRSWKRRQAG